MALDRYGDVLPRSILKPRSAGDGNPVYVALSFADEPELVGLQKTMRRSGIKAEWQDPGLFHCSLLIVEDATDEQLNGLLEGLSLPVRFWAEVASLGTFEADDIPLIANVVASPALIRLQQEFEAAALRMHLPVFEFFRATDYKPHITLGYDSDADIEALPPIPAIIKLRAEAVLLMRDDYNVVRRILLPETAPDRAFVEAGGKGSGHFGHAGIPGHQGGSLPSGIETVSLEEFQANPIPGYEYDPELAGYGEKGWGKVIGQRRGGRSEQRWTALGSGFFALDAERRAALLHHETGHDLGWFFNQDFQDVARPFALAGGVTFDNPFGASKEASEMLADAYAALWEHAETWYEGESDFGKNFNAFLARVRAVAERENMPVPARVVTRGGPGSGHFGHAGRPGEVGGSLPSGEVAEEAKSEPLWATINHPGDTVVYHTRANLWESKTLEPVNETAATIKTEGIHRGGPSAGRPPSVYFSSSLERAEHYGFILGRRNLERRGVEEASVKVKHFVVVEFVIPDIADPLVYADDSDNAWFHVAGKSFRIESDIRPEWVRSVTAYDIRMEQTASGMAWVPVRREVVTRSASGPGYAVIFIAEVSDLVQRHYGPGPHPGTGTDQSVHAGGATSPNKNGQLDGSLAAIERQYPEVEEGERVDGREVRGPASNWDSVSASLAQWESLPGYRIVRMSQFTDLDPNEPPGFYSRELRESTEELARAIKTGQWIEPLIVAVDDKGPWVIEGSHRFDALRILKAKAFPAIVVIDREALPDPDVVQRHYGPGLHAGTGTPQSVHGGGSISGEARPASRLGRRRVGSRARYSPVIAADGMTALAAMPQTQTWRPAWEGLEAIDRVHRMPDYMPDLLQRTTRPGQLPFERSRSEIRSGGYWQLSGDGAKKIGIDLTEMGFSQDPSEEPSHPELTTIHEVAHFLDNVLFGDPETGGRGTMGRGASVGPPGGPAQAVDQAFGDVIVAMRESADYRMLLDQNLGYFAVEGMPGLHFEYPARAARRVREPVEMFARGYSQWIALRSGNPTIRAQVDYRNDLADRGGPRLQWRWDNFEPIAGAYDRLFRAAGLLRSTA